WGSPGLPARRPRGWPYPVRRLRRCGGVAQLCGADRVGAAPGGGRGGPGCAPADRDPFSPRRWLGPGGGRVDHLGTGRDRGGGAARGPQDRRAASHRPPGGATRGGNRPRRRRPGRWRLSRRGLSGCGLIWGGLIWRGLIGRGLSRGGLSRRGHSRRGFVWRGVVWWGVGLGGLV